MSNDFNANEEYHVLEIDDVIPNDWNPNVFPDQRFNALLSSLDVVQSNSHQPIIVRPHPSQAGKYQIVDGEHRYKAMKMLGYEQIVAIIRNYSDKEARIKTIAMNKFRGEFDAALLASVIQDLKDRFAATPDELQELGFTPEELLSYEKLLEINLQEPDSPKVSIKEPEDKNIPLTFPVTPEQANAIQGLLTTLDNTDLGTVISLAAQVIKNLPVGALDQSVIDGYRKLLHEA